MAGQRPAVLAACVEWGLSAFFWGGGVFLVSFIFDQSIPFPFHLTPGKGLGSIRGVFGPMSKISFTLSNYRFVIWDKNYRRYFVIYGTLP